jgi:hypothetical protein
MGEQYKDKKEMSEEEFNRLVEEGRKILKEYEPVLMFKMALRCRTERQYYGPVSRPHCPNDITLVL